MRQVLVENTTMEAIVLVDDELKRLETQFGPAVRQMGPWNSDGVFGYCSVSIVAVEKAIESLASVPTISVEKAIEPLGDLQDALSHLKHTPERTKAFIVLLDGFGPTLIERIVAAHRDFSFYPS
jgi:hypothetical protein